MLFAVALVAVMIGLAEGSGWRWGSPRVLALLVCGVALLAVWSVQQLHGSNSAPLVELRLLRHPAVLAADACATYSAERQEAALRAFGGYCRVTDTNDVIARLEAIR